MLGLIERIEQTFVKDDRRGTNRSTRAVSPRDYAEKESEIRRTSPEEAPSWSDPFLKETRSVALERYHSSYYYNRSPSTRVSPPYLSALSNLALFVLGHVARIIAPGYK